MQSIAARTQAAAKKVEAAGRKMTTALTVPLAAAGAAAVSSAAKMDNALAQAQSQAGLTDEALRHISESAEEIATSTGQSFEKVVEAYKFAQSAGLDLAESQEIVETSAKAAAAGFGDQTTLLRGMTTVMAGYGDEAGSASEIMDKMVATAQRMEVEVPSLTSVMGQLVQVSSETGVSFDEMLAAVGSVGEQFGDVTRAGNLMSTALTQLLDPSQKVRDLMKQVGTSADEVQANIEKKGLTRAMSMLRNQTEAAGIEFARMVGSARSARVMLALTSQDGQRVADIMENAKDSTGALNDAFQDSQSFSRLLSRAWQALRTSIRPLGNVLMNSVAPALAELITKIQTLSERFEAMDQETRAWWLSVLALTAAIGPLTLAIGKLGSLLVGFVSTLGTVAAAVGSFAASWPGLAAAAVAAIVAIVTHWDSFKRNFFEGVSQLQRAWDALAEGIAARFDVAMQRLRLAIGALIRFAFRKLTQLTSNIPSQFVPDTWYTALAGIGALSSQVTKGVGQDLQQAQGEAQMAAAKFEDAMGGAFDSMKAFASDATSEVRSIVGGTIDTMKGWWQSLQQTFMQTPSPTTPGGGGTEQTQRERGGQRARQVEPGGGVRSLNEMIKGLDRVGPSMKKLNKRAVQAKVRLQDMGEKGTKAGRFITSQMRSLTQQMATAIIQAGGVGEAFKSMGRTVVNALTGVIAKLTTAVSLAGILTAVTGGGASALGGGFGGILSNLIGLSEGGFVKDGPMPAVLHGNEAVVPLDRMGDFGGAQNVHVTGEIRQKGTEMRATLQETDTLRRRSGKA